MLLLFSCKDIVTSLLLKVFLLDSYRISVFFLPLSSVKLKSQQDKSGRIVNAAFSRIKPIGDMNSWGTKLWKYGGSAHYVMLQKIWLYHPYDEVTGSRFAK